MGRDREEIVRAGGRLRGKGLVAQAAATARLLARDRKALAEFGVGRDALDRLATLRRAVEKGARNRALAAAEAQSPAIVQGRAVAEAKTWLRQAILVGEMAHDGEPERAADYRAGPKIGTSVHWLTEKVSRVVDLLRGDPAAPLFGATPAFIGRGDALASFLTGTGSSPQDAVARPQEAEDYDSAKGEIYFHLKQLNRAGRAAHAGDPVRAGAYNLLVLQRKAGPKAQGAPRGRPAGRRG
ncbi:MAG: hypothetical protein L0216_21820 [Planctomycetales bacterium]|nr:hypothetical protein [Planctomycetales bacterium]